MSPLFLSSLNVVHLSTDVATDVVATDAVVVAVDVAVVVVFIININT